MLHRRANRLVAAKQLASRFVNQIPAATQVAVGRISVCSECFRTAVTVAMTAAVAELLVRLHAVANLDVGPPTIQLAAARSPTLAATLAAAEGTEAVASDACLTRCSTRATAATAVARMVVDQLAVASQPAVASLTATTENDREIQFEIAKTHRPLNFEGLPNRTTTKRILVSSPFVCSTF
jgi:hypothetical protein